MLCFCRPLDSQCCDPETFHLFLPLPLRLATPLALTGSPPALLRRPSLQAMPGAGVGVEAAIVPAICSVMFLMTVLNEGWRSHIPSLN